MNLSTLGKQVAEKLTEDGKKFIAEVQFTRGNHKFSALVEERVAQGNAELKAAIEAGDKAKVAKIIAAEVRKAKNSEKSLFRQAIEAFKQGPQDTYHSVGQEGIYIYKANADKKLSGWNAGWQKFRFWWNANISHRYKTPEIIATEEFRKLFVLPESGLPKNVKENVDALIAEVFENLGKGDYSQLNDALIKLDTFYRLEGKVDLLKKAGVDAQLIELPNQSDLQVIHINFSAQQEKLAEEIGYGYKLYDANQFVEISDGIIKGRISFKSVGEKENSYIHLNHEDVGKLSSRLQEEVFNAVKKAVGNEKPIKIKKNNGELVEVKNYKAFNKVIEQEKFKKAFLDARQSGDIAKQVVALDKLGINAKLIKLPDHPDVHAVNIDFTAEQKALAKELGYDINKPATNRFVEIHSGGKSYMVRHQQVQTEGYYVRLYEADIKALPDELQEVSFNAVKQAVDSKIKLKIINSDGKLIEVKAYDDFKKTINPQKTVEPKNGQISITELTQTIPPKFKGFIHFEFSKYPHSKDDIELHVSYNLLKDKKLEDQIETFKKLVQYFRELKLKNKKEKNIYFIGRERIFPDKPDPFQEAVCRQLTDVQYFTYSRSHSELFQLGYTLK